ncbi:MAG: hypothetical protein CML95_06055 [Rhodobiaceae bacterium]|nr:hypothetical protein [Rhodobiaceae bacterium]
MAQKKSKKLNPKQVLAAELLGHGCRHSEVAKRLDLRNETISRWMAIEAFQSAINQANRALVSSILGDTTNLINKCHQAISEALESDVEPTKKAGIAIRYLGAYMKPYTVYDKLVEIQSSDKSRDEFVRSMAKIMKIIEHLGYLKSSNSVFTDSEYREFAEQIVCSWGEIDPKIYS